MTTEAEREMTILEDEVNRRRRNDKRQKWGLFILTMLLLCAFAVIVPLLNIALHQVDESGAQVVTEQEEKKDLAVKAQQALCGTKDTEIFDRQLCEELAAAAQEPVIQPAEPPLQLGPSQAELVAAFRAYCDAGNCRGKDGATPTADDIAAAFVKFCADGRCVGTPGQNGKDAEPVGPTPEMVLAAVTIYCSSGACIGERGTDGIDGAPGPGPTEEMVLAAVRTVCADGVCKGDKGDPGEPGQSVTSFAWTDPKTNEKYTCIPDPPGSSTFTCTADSPTPPLLPNL
jgi:hypothetical protein